jgi:hypothetical protein
LPTLFLSVCLYSVPPSLILFVLHFFYLSFFIYPLCFSFVFIATIFFPFYCLSLLSGFYFILCPFFLSFFLSFFRHFILYFFIYFFIFFISIFLYFIPYLFIFLFSSFFLSFFLYLFHFFILIIATINLMLKQSLQWWLNNIENVYFLKCFTLLKPVNLLFILDNKSFRQDTTQKTSCLANYVRIWIVGLTDHEALIYFKPKKKAYLTIHYRVQV